MNEIFYDVLVRDDKEENPTWCSFWGRNHVPLEKAVESVNGIHKHYHTNHIHLTAKVVPVEPEA